MLKRVLKRLFYGASLFFILFCVSGAAFWVAPHPRSIDKPNKYQPIDTLTGNLSLVGSETLGNLVSQWGKEFKAYYPLVNIQVQITGSSAAVPALIEGTAQFGTMSREMRYREIELFERRYGYLPTKIKVAKDGLVIFVHQDNPISGLTLQNLDALYSQSLYCGGTRRIKKWGELGLTGRWKRRDIQLFGRNSTSGTYDFFKQEALCHGDFQVDFNELPGSASVVQAVSHSLNSIGFAGVGYEMAGSKMLPLLLDGAPVYATPENLISNRYPLSRYLYIYVNKPQDKPFEDKEAEFIKYILSPQGQDRLVLDGFAPLPKAQIKAQLIELGLNGIK